MVPLQDSKECSHCFGSGENIDMIGDICPVCNGIGRQAVNCEACQGDGLVNEKVTVSVKIPASVDTGMLLRVRGKGYHSLNGSPGDLILNVYVQPHPEYKRKGFDILSDKEISVTQAIFGGAT